MGRGVVGGGGEVRGDEDLLGVDGDPTVPRGRRAMPIITQRTQEQRHAAKQTKPSCGSRYSREHARANTQINPGAGIRPRKTAVRDRRSRRSTRRESLGNQATFG